MKRKLHPKRGGFGVLRILQKILGFCAKLYLKKNNPFIIGITGSVGKTSCRMIITGTLKQFLKNKKIYTSPENFNSELGLVFSIFEIEEYTPGILNLFNVFIKILGKTLFSKGNYDILVLEYGIDSPGDMDFLLKIAVPDISIFTKLDAIHMENFKNIKSIGEEKFKLMKMTKSLVYLNFKDEYCRKNYDSIIPNKKMYNSDIFEVVNYKIEKNKIEIFSSFEFGKFKIKTNILGRENIDYISVGIDILDLFIKDKGKIIKYMQQNILKYKIQPGRFSIFKGIKDSILIDSSYNAGPESMKKMIENTIELRNKAFLGYKLLFVIGDMRELGKKSEVSHKNIGKLLKNYDLVYTVGQEMKKNLNLEKSFLSSRKAGLKLKDFLNNSKDKYLILFKGSQNTIFVEEALKQVLENKQDKKTLVRQSSYWIKKKGLN